MKKTSRDTRLKVRVKTAKKRSLSSTLWLRTPAQRSLCRPRQARRISLARGLQADRDRRQISFPQTRCAGGRSWRGSRRLEPDRGQARGRARRQRARWSPSTSSRWMRSPASISWCSISSMPMHPISSRRNSAAGPMWCSPTWRRMRPATARPIICGSWVWSRRRRNSPRKFSRPTARFVAKVLQGGTENELLAVLKRDFQSVKHVKPAASRSDSSELYVVATGYRPPSSA